MEKKDFMQMIIGICIAMVITIAYIATEDTEFAMMICGGLAGPFALMVWYIGLKG